MICHWKKKINDFTCLLSCMKMIFGYPCVYNIVVLIAYFTFIITSYSSLHLYSAIYNKYLSLGTALGWCIYTVVYYCVIVYVIVLCCVLYWSLWVLIRYPAEQVTAAVLKLHCTFCGWGTVFCPGLRHHTSDATLSRACKENGALYFDLLKRTIGSHCSLFFFFMDECIFIHT